MRRCYEDAARLAERETLSYERYLLELVTREFEDWRHKRIQRLLRQSRIPAEKSLANFNLKHLPAKVGMMTKTLLEASFWIGAKTCWRSEIPAAERRICCARLVRN